jgi:hypothetical protein
MLDLRDDVANCGHPSDGVVHRGKEQGDAVLVRLLCGHDDARLALKRVAVGWREGTCAGCVSSWAIGIGHACSGVAALRRCVVANLDVTSASGLVIEVEGAVRYPDSHP